MEIHQIYWHTGKSTRMGPDRFAYCPQCGAALVHAEIDGRDRHTCPSCSYIHFRNPTPTVSLLIVQNDRVLLGKRTEPPGRDRWATPSGYIEVDEDFLTAAVREAKEETGLDVVLISILNITESFFPPNNHFLNLYLLAQVAGGQLQAGDDLAALCWFPLAGPFPQMAFREDIDLIERYRRVGDRGLPVEPANHRPKPPT